MFQLSRETKFVAGRFVILFSILLPVFGSLCCQKATDFKPKSNSPPIINSVNILRQSPYKNSQLDLIVHGEDPEGDSVTYDYQWIRNGEEILGEKKSTLTPEHFKKGDFIRVRAIPSDGKVQGKPFLSEPVKILNSSPVIQEVRIEPKIAYASDSLRVDVKSDDVDGDTVYCTYRWEKNGVILTEEKTEILERSRFKKGDVIVVTVTPDDREGEGVPKKSEPITILNSPPIIVSSPSASIEGNACIYQIKTHDPDNDPIAIALKSAPKGMEIDNETGLIRWKIQSKDKGTHAIEIEVSDKEGAKSFQRFVLNVDMR